jgi:periplasmic divalent cation tolerance protein
MPASRSRPKPVGAAGVVLLLSAFPRRASAERVARDLVLAGVVACATVVGGGRAYYRWKNRLRAEPSVLLWGKTTSRGARAAVDAIRALHSDAVPEILVIRVRGGDPSYLRWIAETVNPPRSGRTSRQPISPRPSRTRRSRPRSAP